MASWGGGVGGRRGYQGQKITGPLFRVWELLYLTMVMLTGWCTITKVNQIIYLKVGDFCYMLIIVQ